MKLSIDQWHFYFKIHYLNEWFFFLKKKSVGDFILFFLILIKVNSLTLSR